jgi:hypothetical protein
MQCALVHALTLRTYKQLEESSICAQQRPLLLSGSENVVPLIAAVISQGGLLLNFGVAQFWGAHR